MQDTGKRVAMISYSLYHNDDRIRRHVKNLVSDGFEVDLISLAYPGASEQAHEEGLRLFLPRARCYGDHSQARILWEYIAFAWCCLCILLSHHLKDKRYTLVHVNNMPNFLIFSAIPLRLLGVPVLLDIHDTMPEIYQDKYSGPMKWLLIQCLFIEEKISMWVADFVITTEHTKWKRLLTNGLKKRKSDVVMNCSDPAIWPEQEIASADQGDGSPFRLIYHGTLARRLGLDLAIQAVSILKDKIPNIRLDIIGDGDQRSNLIELAKELHMEDYVQLSDGFVSVEKLPALVNGAHLAVLPSRNTIATRYMLPGKLLEYIRFGVPAVTVATPTITYYFTDQQVKFVPSEDPQALADMIYYLYEHPEERQRMACEAKKFFETYNFGTEGKRYLDVLHTLIDKRGKRR